jgi:hypothetical protein
MGALIIKLIVGVVLVAAFGGQGGPVMSEAAMVTGDAEVDKALDEMKFENAPTLGPFLRRCMVAMYKGDGTFLWDNVSQWTHDWAQKNLEGVRKNPSMFDVLLKHFEEALAKAKTEEEKASAQAGIDNCKTLKELLPEISPKDYFILSIENTAKISRADMKRGILEDKREVVGEEIAADGKSAVLKLKYVKSGKKEELRFVKEDGVWKFEMWRVLFP